MNDEELTEIFRKAAEYVLSQWLDEQWDNQSEALDDLVQDLWAWYLPRPSIRKWMEGKSERAVQRIASMGARQILSRQALDRDTFEGRALYSSDSVREALRGESTNEYLIQILPEARANLDSRNPRQAEAVRRRYDDGDVPHDPAEASVLSRAVKSLTEDVNVTYITSEAEAIGSSSAVFPETRKPRGMYADPTGNTVVMLDENPEFRYHYYADSHISQFLGGAGSRPAYAGKIGDKTVWFRP